MAINDDNSEHKAVIRYDQKYDEKGRMVLKPVFLKETPPEEIKRMNEEHQEWKKYKQD